MARRPWVVRQIGPALRRAWWAYLRVRGLDVTTQSATRSCLVLAPHADDETLGCAVAIMRKRDASTPVHIVIAADGRHATRSDVISPAELAKIRRDEALVACARMGVDEAHVSFLEVEDTLLDAFEEEVTHRIADLMRRLRPQEVFVTAVDDPHPDHAALGRAARAATKGTADVTLYEYPIWQWRSPGSWRTLAQRHAGASPRRASWQSGMTDLMTLRPCLIRIDGYRSRKQDVLAAYRSQTHNVTGEQAWWSLDKRFLANFFRSHELFFIVEAGQHEPSVAAAVIPEPGD